MAFKFVNYPNLRHAAETMAHVDQRELEEDWDEIDVSSYTDLTEEDWQLAERCAEQIAGKPLRAFIDCDGEGWGEFDALEKLISDPEHPGVKSLIEEIQGVKLVALLAELESGDVGLFVYAV